MALHTVVEDLAHELRYRAVRPHLRPCDTWVDLGCGREYRFLKRFGYLARSCYGFDIAAPNLTEGNLTLRRADLAHVLSIEDASVDQITILAVLEHLAAPRSVIAECRRVLKPNGRVIATTPTHLGIQVHEVLQRLRLVRDVERGEHQDYRMSKERLARWFRDAGLTVETARTFEAGMNVLVVARRT